MESQSGQSPLIVIVGETASGKSALALELAQQCNGEIIAADSRTVYKGMDIGTAKPSPDEQRLVPHHLLDVATPDQRFTVADFKRLAQGAIIEVSKRGRIPFLVGGSGLYIDAILYDFTFKGEADMQQRQRLQALSVEELQQELKTQGVPLPENRRNPRHLIRALETGGMPAVRTALRPNTLVIGLEIDRQRLKSKLEQRVDAMVDQGFLEEVGSISEQYGWDLAALQAPGYKAFRAYLAGELTLSEAKAAFVRNDFQLAKRQRTWFKRNKDINWISRKEEAVDLITTFLNK